MWSRRQTLNRGRKRTPTFIQMEVTECGAACLGMILGYYGKHVSLNELRMACGVSRDGCNAHDILEAAENYGLDSNGYSLDLDELREMTAPLVIFWEFRHFVVLEGFRGDTVYVNDPATGPVTMTVEDFRKGYTGIALEMLPTQDFQRGGKRPSLLALLAERIQAEQNTFFFLFSVSLLLTSIMLIWGATVQFFLDHMFPHVDDLFQWGFAAAILGIFFAGGLLSALENYYLARFGIRLSLRMNSDFYWKLLRLPMRFYEQRHSGELAHRTSLNDDVADTLSHQLVSTLVQLALVFIYLALIFYFDFWIGCMALGCFILTMGLHVLLHRKRADAHARLAQEFGEYQGSAISGILNIESIKVGGREGSFFHRLAALHAKTVNAMQNLQKYDVYLIAVTGVVNSLTLMTLLTVGAWNVFQGSMTIGMLYFLKILLDAFTKPVTQLAHLSDQIQRLEVNLYRLNDVTIGDVDSSTMRTLSQSVYEVIHRFKHNPQARGSLVVKNLTYGYASRDKPLLQNLSFELHPGEVIALTGMSSVGKSTLMRLLSGLYEPWSGDLLLGGRPVQSLPRELIANSMALVQQKPFLFEGTVRENLTLFDTSISDKFILDAAKIAHIHDVIIARPQDYDGMVMEQGVNFSGGQRQRLELGRALVKRPRILLIDEATSGVEQSIELSILQELKRQGITCLVATQRQKTMAICDKILVLNNGCIEQEGSHKELLKVPGIYRSLAEKGEI